MRDPEVFPIIFTISPAAKLEVEKTVAVLERKIAGPGSGCSQGARQMSEEPRELYRGTPMSQWVEEVANDLDTTLSRLADRA